MDVPLNVVPPSSELARLPYFALTEALTCELLKLRADIEQARCTAADCQQREQTANAVVEDTRQAVWELQSHNTELSSECEQLAQKVRAMTQANQQADRAKYAYIAMSLLFA